MWRTLDYLKCYFKPFLKNEEGQGMVEYALIIALIAILLITVLGTMQGGLEAIFQQIADTLDPPDAPEAP